MPLERITRRTPRPGAVLESHVIIELRKTYGTQLGRPHHVRAGQGLAQSSQLAHHIQRWPTEDRQCTLNRHSRTSGEPSAIRFV